MKTNIKVSKGKKTNLKNNNAIETYKLMSDNQQLRHFERIRLIYAFFGFYERFQVRNQIPPVFGVWWKSIEREMWYSTGSLQGVVEKQELKLTVKNLTD